MRVFVTGGTGFVGQEIVSRLVQREHQVVLLARNPQEVSQGGLTQIVAGDITDPESYRGALADCQACVHLVGILREFPGEGITFEKLNYKATLDLVKACSGHHVKRFLHMSANGAERALGTDYFLSKAREEQAVQASDLDWTIFRPSVVYGGDQSKPSFLSTIKEAMKHAPIFPYFGSGNFRLSPVSAEEVAESFVSALENPDTHGKCYHLCGPETYRYKDLLKLVGEQFDKKVRLFPVPFWAVQVASSALGGFAWFPLTNEMLKMLKAGNVCPEGALTQRDLGVTLRSFESFLKTEVGQLPEAKVTTLLGSESAPPLDEN